MKKLTKSRRLEDLAAETKKRKAERAMCENESMTEKRSLSFQAEVEGQHDPLI